MNRLTNEEKHNRIKNLAYLAKVYGVLDSCHRQPNDSYIITLTRDLKPTIHTINSAVIFLFFLTVAAQPEIETETETETGTETGTETIL